jgi:hypothetical protein
MNNPLKYNDPTGHIPDDGNRGTGTTTVKDSNGNSRDAIYKDSHDSGGNVQCEITYVGDIGGYQEYPGNNGLSVGVGPAEDIYAGAASSFNGYQFDPFNSWFTGGSTDDSDVGSANSQQTEGPGKWVNTGVDKVGGRNLLQMIVNRTESLGDAGRVFGSDGKDFKITVQDVTQKWRALSTSVVENLMTNGYISVDRTYGETRVIRQTFIEGPDPWQQSGKSWTWQPAVRNEEFELQRLQ